MVSNLDDTLNGVAELRARAERYRLLAETLFDPNMIAIAKGCARELEAAATAQEPRTTNWKRPIGR
jgi:hypothetical protein